MISSDMNTEERSEKQKVLIEEIGRVFDKEGFQPIAGRILGLLMVTDKEQYTFDEITEELQISKSSASNTLRNLEIRGDIEYITLPGDRKRYFQLKTSDSFKIMEDLEKKIAASSNLFKNIIDLKADKNSKNAVFLANLLKMMNEFLMLLNKANDGYRSGM
jgi:DNA-binding transcriptional regulator GbsR (MarR family)